MSFITKKGIKQGLKSALLFLIIFTLAQYWVTRNLANGDAVNFELKNLQGENFSFDAQQLKEPVLLHFFATWCPICKLENESLVDISKDFPTIMVAMQSGEVTEIQSYKDEHGLNMPIYNDHSGKVSTTYKVTGVPTSFIINKQGEIIFSSIGYTSKMGLIFRLWMANYL